MDASMNMQAVTLEHRLGRPVLPSLHGAWTAGGLVATLLTLAIGEIDLLTGAIVLAVVALALLVAPLIRHDVAPVASDGPGVSWRSMSVIGLGLVLFYMVDTASTAWGPVYLASTDVFTDPPASSQMVALATLPYLAATLLARLAGDRATARLGVPTMLRVGAVNQRRLKAQLRALRAELVRQAQR